MGGFELGEKFIEGVANARTGALTHLEDFADRLNHFFSCGIILMLSGVTMANVYFLRPISCTLPTAPQNRFNEFAESICWVRGTIGLSDEDPIPMNANEWQAMREKADISFYQWVPFCLSIQAMLFFIPHVVWQSLATYTVGENLEAILAKAKKAELADDVKTRASLVKTAACQLYRLTRQHRDLRRTKWAKLQRRAARLPGGWLLAGGKRMGNTVALSYLFVKLLYLTNAIGQLFIIQSLLGVRTNLMTFGNKLVSTLVAKREWQGSMYFPRQTYCPVTVRHLGTKFNTFTAICALPVNMFNEKIYIFLWLWIAAVSIITALSLCLWLGSLLLQKYEQRYILDYLITSKLSLLPSDSDESNLDEFASDTHLDLDKNPILTHFFNEFIRCDGAFLLRMIRINAGDVVTGEILCQWWELFVQLESKPRKPAISSTLGIFQKTEQGTHLNGDEK